jgi:hypothetical protein
LADGRDDEGASGDESGLLAGDACQRLALQRGQKRSAANGSGRGTEALMDCASMVSDWECGGKLFNGASRRFNVGSKVFQTSRHVPVPVPSPYPGIYYSTNTVAQRSKSEQAVTVSLCI